VISQGRATSRGSRTANKTDRLCALASVATTDKLIAERPAAARGALEAIVAAQAALRADVALATEVGRKRFGPSEAELIAELIRRDLPYYDPAISEKTVRGMNAFARDVGILDDDVAYADVVATQFSGLWRS
jgi:ABC-type nitrate/sulfonate/bicarbonate transport system substrate-binding protein